MKADRGGETPGALGEPSTMANDSPESDWKVFRELRELALERFCKRTLAEIHQPIQDRSLTQHERYLAVVRLLKRRDRELAHAFDDSRRSRMIEQLCAVQALGLFTSDELDRFSAPTREKVQALAEIVGR